jgi:hypothetical protein
LFGQPSQLVEDRVEALAIAEDRGRQNWDHFVNSESYSCTRTEVGGRAANRIGHRDWRNGTHFGGEPLQGGGRGFHQEGAWLYAPWLPFDISALCMAEVLAWVAAQGLFIGCGGDTRSFCHLSCF